MRYVAHCLALPLVFLLIGCASLPKESSGVLAEARLTYPDGRPAGVARLEADALSLRIRANVIGAPTGEHGFHLHMIGKCEAPGFTSAGGHLNPSGRKHGSLAADGQHLGDLENVLVDEKGNGSVIQSVGKGKTGLGDIFDADGTAVVLHAQPDDYRTDPTGNAGARIACGVLQRATAK